MNKHMNISQENIATYQIFVKASKKGSIRSPLEIMGTVN